MDYIRIIEAERNATADQKTVSGDENGVSAGSVDATGLSKDFTALSKDWFWEVDADLSYTFVSPQVEHYTGRQPAFFMGKALGQGMHCDPATKDWESFKKALREGKEVASFQFSYFRRDGQEGIMQFSTMPVYDERGEVTGHRGCGRDVTLENQNSEQLEVIQHRLADTIETVPYGVALFDESDRLVFLNSEKQDVMADLEDIMVPGVSFEELVREFAKRGIQDVKDGDIDAYVQKRMALYHNGYGKREFRLSNGRWIEMSEHVANQGGTVITWLDVTHIKSREKALTSLLGDTASNWSVSERASKAAAHALACRWAGVVRRRDDGTGEVVSFWNKNELGAPYIYDMASGPCQHVYEDEGVLMVRDMATYFPDDKLLEGGNPVSYYGMAITDMRGRAIGHIFVANDRPFDTFAMNKEMFRLIARWVEMEFRRQGIHEKMVYSQQRFRDFAEVSSDWFWEMDSDLRYKFISEHAGIESQSSLQDVILNAHKRLTGEKANSAAIAETSDQIKAHQPFKDVTFTIEDQKTGKERTLKISGRPVFDDKGTFMGYRGTGSDVTDIVDALERAHQAESWLKNAIETSPEAFALYDRNDRMIVCNQKYKDAFFNGIQHEVKAGMSYEELARLHHTKGPKDSNIQDAEAWIKKRVKDRQGNDPLPSHESHINGRYLRAMEHRTDDGGIACFYVDITDLRENEKGLMEAKEAAEVASRGKSDFLANMSHELRTPLNAIIGFSELIRDDLAGPPDGERYKDYVNDIHSSGKHLMDLINDILDLSKAEAGQIRQYAEEVDIRDVAKTALSMVRQRAEEGHVELITQINDDVPKLYIDPKRFRQVLLNLLSNAIKFTPEQGRVTLSAMLVPTGIEIAVEDTGIGIAKEDLPKALSAFGQVDSSLSRRYEGTGLGLPLTKKLIEGSDGRLSIESEPNVGTKVTVFFPKSRLR